MKVKVLTAKELTTLGIGRPTRVYFPEDLSELSLLVREGFKPIGGGSNSVVSGETPLISLKGFQRVELKEKEITLGAGVPLRKVLKLQMKRGFLLFEFLAGIPRATVGGLIAQNAGAFNREVKELLKEVTFVTYSGEVKKLTEFKGFSYRESPFPKSGVVVEAKFKIEKEEKEKVKEKIREFVLRRLSKQPPFFLRTAGSTFKNPPEESAGRLLDNCGLRGFSVGDLKFSEKHANFLINEGRGTLKDFQEIVEIGKERVRELFGIELNLEVKIL